jgi:hypothetical protein
VHEGGYSVSLDTDGRRTFRDPAGRDLHASPPLPPHPQPLSPTRGRTLTGAGEGMNLGYCVDAVLSATGAA